MKSSNSFNITMAEFANACRLMGFSSKLSRIDKKRINVFKDGKDVCAINLESNLETIRNITGHPNYNAFEIAQFISALFIGEKIDRQIWNEIIRQTSEKHFPKVDDYLYQRTLINYLADIRHANQHN